MIYNFVGSANYGNRQLANPFAGGPLLNDVQDRYFRDTPSAVLGDFMGGINLNGRGAFSNNFRTFADQWSKNLYGDYEGAMGRGTLDPDLSFRDYLGSQTGALNQQFAYANSIGRPLARPNRWLRRS